MTAEAERDELKKRFAEWEGLRMEEMSALKAQGFREGVERAAEECDTMATTELMCDTYDDLRNAEPFHRAAKSIRSLLPEKENK